MKKQRVVCLIAFILLALIIPSNINAKEQLTEKVICKYQYQNGINKELTYKVYANEVVLPFEDGENNWYHGQDFVKTYLESAKIDDKNYVCPTITVEESSSFITIFNNPKKIDEYNGNHTTLIATEINSSEFINVKKAVDTTAIGSVGIYNDDKYFIPYFRVLEDGTKQWSVNGKKFISIDSSAIVKTAPNTKIVIKLDDKLINKVFINNKLNSNVTIYRNVKQIKTTKYEYLLSTSKADNYNLTDGQETKAASYNAAYGEPSSEDMEDWLEGYDQQQDCTGKEGLLGSYDDPDSVAWLLQRVFNYLKLIGPFIVVIMSGIDFAKVIIMGDDDGMKKAQTKLITRLLLAASLFFLPDLVTALLELFGITSSGICGLN